MRATGSLLMRELAGVAHRAMADACYAVFAAALPHVLDALKDYPSYRLVVTGGSQQSALCVALCFCSCNMERVQGTRWGLALHRSCTSCCTSNCRRCRDHA